MKRLLMTMAMAASTLGVRAAHADPEPVWYEVGQGVQAAHIGVGASDYPFIIRADGSVFIGNPGCASGTVCPNGSRNWVKINHSQNFANAKIAVNLGNGLWVQDSANETYDWDYARSVWFHDGNFTFAGGSRACMSTFAVSTTTDYNFPQVAYPQQFYFEDEPWNASSMMPNFWGTDCNSTRHAWRLDVNEYNDGTTGYQIRGTTQWTQIDTYPSTDDEITLFSTAYGSNVVQVPWVYSHGYAYPVGSNGIAIQEPLPWLFKTYHLSYLTDGYALGGNIVWRWNGDVFGNPSAQGAPWIIFAAAPSGVTFTEIAAASAIPGTFAGTIGPSEVWAIDTNGNVWVEGLFDPGPPPK